MGFYLIIQPRRSANWETRHRYYFIINFTLVPHKISLGVNRFFFALFPFLPFRVSHFFSHWILFFFSFLFFFILSIHFFASFPSPHTKNHGLTPRDKMFYPKLFRLPAKGLRNERKIEWRGGNLKMSTRSALRYISYTDLLRFITRRRISFRNSHRRGKWNAQTRAKEFFSTSKITY